MGLKTILTILFPSARTKIIAGECWGSFGWGFNKQAGLIQLHAFSSMGFRYVFKIFSLRISSLIYDQ